MKKLFLIKNIFIIIIIYLLLITKINSLEEKETEYEFLEKKTVDNLRQIYWNMIEIWSETNNSELKEFMKTSYEITWKKYNRKEIINIITGQLDYVMFSNIKNSEELMKRVKENDFFQINNLADLKKLIQNEKLEKNFLINFAFNIDKYDRTKRKFINSVSDYINFYKTEEIQEFIINKLDEYFNNFTPKEELEKIVLNNYVFDYSDTTKYIEGKSKNELIQLIYGLEKYCFSSTDKVIEEGCLVPYNLYIHSKLDTYSENDLFIKIQTFNKRLQLEKDLDKFIYLIENREFTYPNYDDIIKNINQKLIPEYVISLEAYYRKQTNTNRKLRKLEDYVSKMGSWKINEILKWGMNLYPELIEKGRFNDITSSERYLQYGKVKDFVNVKARNDLLKYAYNIHTYQNKINSIYDKNIYDFIRLNDSQLFEQIFIDTNKDKKLQKYDDFVLYASLHYENFEYYLKNLQRNQLKIITIGLINLYFVQGIYNGDTYKRLSEKKELLDSLYKLSNSELIDMSLDYIKKLKYEHIITIFTKDVESDSYINYYFTYYENIMDFLRSTDINYLKLWLRKYELILRKNKTNLYLSGGLKTNFMNLNEYTKDDLLNIFDNFIYDYPELFIPKNFIKFVGLDTGITPHKFIVDNMDNKDIINNITLSIIGHYQRKNVQANFDCSGALSYSLRINEEIDDNKHILKSRNVYQLFRLLNVLPELNNINLFMKMCLNETRIINLEEYNSVNDDLESIFNDKKIKEMEKNLDFYYNKTTPSELQNKDSDPVSYILKFLTNSGDDILKSRVLDGDFYTIFYDYSIFFKDDKDVVINNIYDKLLNESKIENKTENKNINREEKIKAICTAIDGFKELQDPSYFDLNYYYIDLESEGYSALESLYKFLNKTDIRNVFYYCLIANILKIEYENENVEINNENIRDIYLKIHYMPKITMIRYILDIANLKGDFEKQLSPEKLPLLVKKYMLDIGSDNIYDLTLY